MSRKKFKGVGVTKGYRCFQVFNYLIMLCVCAVVILPLYYMVIVSISDGAAGADTRITAGYSLPWDLCTVMA